MAKEKIVQSSMRLPVSLWKAVGELAASKDLSVQQVVTRALREYIERHTQIRAKGKYIKKRVKQPVRGAIDYMEDQ